MIPSDNRPRPLRNAPIPLLSDELSLLSFGERAALEGVLRQLKPRLSLEIGTYEGGSLRLIAEHSGQVHSFDAEDLVPAARLPTNVTFHHGDSKVNLPAVLAQCAATGTPVDFAFVDGDHSAEGVRADLGNLIHSPACSRSLILLHDTMNPEVRRGLESVALDQQPAVVYAELDFVSGYQFREGYFAGQWWGGLGLVVTGDRATDGYGEDPLQSSFRAGFALLPADAGNAGESHT